MTELPDIKAFQLPGDKYDELFTASPTEQTGVLENLRTQEYAFLTQVIYTIHNHQDKVKILDSINNFNRLFNRYNSSKNNGYIKLDDFDLFDYGNLVDSYYRSQNNTDEEHDNAQEELQLFAYTQIVLHAFYGENTFKNPESENISKKICRANSSSPVRSLFILSNGKPEDLEIMDEITGFMVMKSLLVNANTFMDLVEESTQIVGLFKAITQLPQPGVRISIANVPDSFRPAISDHSEKRTDFEQILSSVRRNFSYLYAQYQKTGEFDQEKVNEIALYLAQFHTSEGTNIEELEMGALGIGGGHDIYESVSQAASLVDIGTNPNLGSSSITEAVVTPIRKQPSAVVPKNIRQEIHLDADTLEADLKMILELSDLRKIYNYLNNHQEAIRNNPKLHEYVVKNLLNDLNIEKDSQDARFRNRALNLIYTTPAFTLEESQMMELFPISIDVSEKRENFDHDKDLDFWQKYFDEIQHPDKNYFVLKKIISLKEFSTKTKTLSPEDLIRAFQAHDYFMQSLRSGYTFNANDEIMRIMETNAFNIFRAINVEVSVPLQLKYFLVSRAIKYEIKNGYGQDDRRIFYDQMREFKAIFAGIYPPYDINNEITGDAATISPNLKKVYDRDGHDPRQIMQV